ncbi:MAG: hypothetical protein HYX67_11025 [Candidatus Melainabacteria bacterium]|nr:hypothetical protein [Candidatus Melainabacteria bacterium]
MQTSVYIFSTFSIINTILSGISYFVPGAKLEGFYPLLYTILFSIFIGFIKVWKPSKIEIPIANCNTVIEVLFGDLFDQTGIRAIAVTEYFDSVIGTPVSDKSVHGLFLKKCFGGTPEAFDKQVDEQLKTFPYETENLKTQGKNKRYKIGTTALISVNNNKEEDRYLLFAFSTADPKTCKANSDVTKMWDALHELWQRARIETGGHDLNLPLVGSGLSGLGLPARDLLNLIILSAITETKSNAITQRIRIVLHRDRHSEELDLRDVRKYWIK